MNLFKVLMLFVLFASPSFGQDIDIRPLDNNPKLTMEESAWLNGNIKPDGFNFGDSITACISFTF